MFFLAISRCNTNNDKILGTIWEHKKEKEGEGGGKV